MKTLNPMVGMALGLLMGHAAAHAGTLRGRVVDTAGTPLVGAHVRVEGTGQGTTTNLDGEYRLDRVPEGARLVVSHVGFAPVAKVLPAGAEARLDLSLAPTAFEMSPLVVTGTRTPRFVLDAPVRTEVITRSDLRLRSADNLYQALEASPGIRVEEQCQACNFSEIRMNGLGADHTQVLLDGMPLYSGLAAVYGLQQFGTEEVDRIEVVRGAGSALYGSNAIAGAVNIISRRPTQNSLEAGLEAASFGGRRLQASAARVQDAMAMQLHLQTEHQDAVDATRDGNGRSQVKGGDGVSDRVETDTRSVGASLHAGTLEGAGEWTARVRLLNEVRMGGVMTDDSYRNPYTAGTEHITTDRITAGLDHERRLPGGAELSLRLSHVDHQRTATNDTYLGDYESVHGVTPAVEDMRPYQAEERMWVGNAGLSRGWGSHRLQAGMQVSWDRVEESGRYIVVDEADPHWGVSYTSTSRKEARDLGFYLQDEWRISPAWEVVAGVRQDWHRSTDQFGAQDGISQAYPDVDNRESRISPRLALKWAAREGTTARLSLGTGFKVPFGFSEDLHLCSGSPRVWKDGSLRPESSRSVTLGLDQRLGNWSAGLNLGVTRLYDAVGVVDAAADVASRGYTYQYENIDDATVGQLDLEGAWQARPDLRLSLSWSLFRGRYDEARTDWAGTQYEDLSRRISRYPARSGLARVDWRPGPWNLSLDASHTGEMVIDYAAEGDLGHPDSYIHRTEPFTLLNAQLGRALGGGHRVHLGVRNLGNYLQPVKHIDDAAFQYAPVYGRIWYAGFQVSL